jgi:hypothetical protein
MAGKPVEKNDESITQKEDMWIDWHEGNFLQKILCELVDSFLFFCYMTWENIIPISIGIIGWVIFLLTHPKYLN